MASIQKKIDNPEYFFLCVGSGLFSLGVFCGVLSYLYYPKGPLPKEEDYIERITDLKRARECASHNFFDKGLRDFYFKSSEWGFEKRFQYVDVFHISKYSSDCARCFKSTTDQLLNSFLCFLSSVPCLYEFFGSVYKHRTSLQRDKKLLAILKAEKCRRKK